MTVPAKLNVDSVNAWVQQLPYANKPVLARETYELIEGLAESKLPIRQRLQILEAIKRPVSVVLDYIRQRLAAGWSHQDELLPLGEAYCERVSTICQSLLPDDARARPRLLRFGNNVSAQALALGNHYLEQWYLLRVVTHREVPEGFWRSVRALAARSGTAEIAPLARLLALHLAGPSGMTPRQVHSVTKMLAALPMERLLKFGGPSAGGKPGFYIADNDSPPSYGELPDGAVALNLKGLVRALGTGAKPNLAPLLLGELLHRWSGNRPERQPRRVTQRPIKTPVVIGLRGVVRHLQEMEPPQGGGSAFAPEPLEAHAVANAFQSDNNPFARRSEATQASFLDVSDGGCRLRTGWDGVQAGDIIAVHWGRVDWRIGSLAWIVRDEDEWECGVQWLLNKPRAAMVRFDAGEPTVAIVGDCRHGDREGLIYGAGSNAGQALGERRGCMLKSNGQWQDYTLTSRKTTGLADLAEVELAQSASEPELVPMAPQSYGTGEDSVWSALSAMGATPARGSGR